IFLKHQHIRLFVFYKIYNLLFNGVVVNPIILIKKTNVKAHHFEFLITGYHLFGTAKLIQTTNMPVTNTYGEDREEYFGFEPNEPINSKNQVYKKPNRVAQCQNGKYCSNRCRYIVSQVRAEQ